MSKHIITNKWDKINDKLKKWIETNKTKMSYHLLCIIKKGVNLGGGQMSSYSSSLEKYLTKVLGSNLVVCRWNSCWPSLPMSLILGGCQQLVRRRSGLAVLCFKRVPKKKTKKTTSNQPKSFRVMLHDDTHVKHIQSCVQPQPSIWSVQGFPH
jgi:hypothetical protein